MSKKQRDLKAELVELKAAGEAPNFLTEEGLITLSGGYLLEGETPKGMYKRVAKSVASYINPAMEDKFFDYMWKGWLCPATPVLTNSGTDRGFPISCFGADIGDNLEEIGEGMSELMGLTKAGGGVGVNFDRIRGRGTPIKGGINGQSSGVVPFMKMYDSVILGTNQGSSRRGSAVINLNIEHTDWEEFIRTRRPEGDVNRQCHNIHQSTLINDNFMEKVKAGDQLARHKWVELLKTRLETGESYIMWLDKVNEANPQCYKDRNLNVEMTNLCVHPDTEILTKKGLKRIQDLENKRVSVWNGIEWSTTTVLKTGENQKLRTVRFSNGEELKCTPYHKFRLQTSYGRGGLAYSAKNQKEVRAAELKPGDKLIKWNLPVIDMEGEIESPYTQGFFSGDGCSHKGKNHIDLYGEKKELLQYLDYKEHRSMREVAGKLRIHINNNFKKFEVPTGSIETRLKWLAGLLDSDGTVAINGNNKSLQIASINKQFLLDTKRMLMTLGVEAKVTLNKKAGKTLMPDGRGGERLFDTKEIYRLLVPTGGLLQLKDLGIECHRLNLNINKLPNREAKQFVKVIEVLDLNEVSDTYCFNEPKRNMGMFNGILAGNCSEITLHTDSQHSFICCLSSLNVTKWDEWKDTDLPGVATYFLNGVLNEFIDKGKDVWGLEKAIRSAVKGRAIGIGILGWHTLLQSKMLPFGSFQSMQLNNDIFATIKEKSVKASKELAAKLGEPEWCRGSGMYNSHLLAQAPTRSNSIISGDVSFGIEPYVANAYADKTHKGKFSRKNKQLAQLLDSKGKNTAAVWKSINENQGSVQHLKFLSDLERDVFRTAYEIDQRVLVQQASQRGRHICQAQSLNLFFPHDVDHKYFNEVHMLAYELPHVKTLYYCRSTSGLTTAVKTGDDECVSCGG